MKGATHAAFGAVAAGGVLVSLRYAGHEFEPAVFPVAVSLSILGSLLPDIDHPHSLASRGLPRAIIGQVLRVALPLLALAGILLYMGEAAAGRKLLVAFTPLLRWSGLIAAVALGFLLASFAVRAVTGHRGITHSFACAAAMSLVACGGLSALALPWWYGLFLGLGWLTHLAGDVLSRDGLPLLLWPFAPRRGSS